MNNLEIASDEMDIFEYAVRAESKRNTRVDKSGKQSITHIYSVPELHLDEYLEGLAFNDDVTALIRVETKHIIGIYAECSDKNFLIYQPQLGSISLEPEHFNYTLDAELTNELKAFGTEHNIVKLMQSNFETLIALLVTYTFALSHLHKIDAEELFKLKAFNSHQVLLNRFRSFSAGDYIPTKNHLNNFSWVYYLELRIIAEIMKGAGSLIVHDVATNMGSFPCLLNALNEDELFGLQLARIECSDVNVDIVKRSIGDISLNGSVNHDNIVVKYLDLLEDNPPVEEADVITANDVLEHFPEDLSKIAFRNLWRRTKRLLVIHVPPDEDLNLEYGHLTPFNQNKLNLWASELDNCKNITADYKSILKLCPHLMGDEGYLFLVKAY